jgi:Tfp pilus assembly protein PilV
MRRRRQRGISLLEVLAAMSLFALVSAAMATLAITSIRGVSANRHSTVATMLAQWEMERVRALDYTTITSASSSQTVAGVPYNIATVVQANTPGANMSDVRVTVSWTGPEGSKSYSTETIYTDVTL